MNDIAYPAGIVWIPESAIEAGVDVEPGIRLLRLPDSVPQAGHVGEVPAAMTEGADLVRTAKLFGYLATFSQQRSQEGYSAEEIIEAMRRYAIAAGRVAEARGGKGDTTNV